MKSAELAALSKLMSLVLRHKPDAFGVVLDAEGFTPLDALLDAVRSRFPDCSLADLRLVVRTVEPSKQRFCIRGPDIRANYGHSLGPRVRHPEATPPSLLLHGTARSRVRRILSEGLRPMSRQYVHLTQDEKLALLIGSRHGKPQVLRVDASAASAGGCTFYRAGDAFWLVTFVPPQFIST